jgi:glyoxylase-like metal-dependent hydrolase (beta-lactamase superfamily II)
MTSLRSGQGFSVLDDVYCLTTQIVNVYFLGEPRYGKPWVLVDAGLHGAGKHIIQAAVWRFGPQNPPRAIVLTHGHFDHVGALSELIRQWDIPVYAHTRELPYLTGAAAYDGPYPEAGNGLISSLSRFFPHSPIDISERVHALPEDGSIPGLADWEWIHTPGHTPGHVSLFRRQDRALIAGDAFVTVKQEALYKVLTQKREISGPPRYFTEDWASAQASVERLHALGPAVAMTGHGVPMSGDELSVQLGYLAAHFAEVAVPQNADGPVPF